MEENIDMPIEQDVTIELILSVFKNYSDSKRMKEIKDIIVSLIHKLNCPVLFIARIQLIIYIFTRYKLN